MNHPFQCIATVKPLSTRRYSGDYLLAACGSKLLSVCLTNGKIVSEWTADVEVRQSSASVDNRPNEVESSERLIKKQKTVPSPSALPNVIKLTVSPDARHAVVVTDNKCVHVFEVQDDGKLLELSQRFMPKRPCAVHVLPDNATILCGDKFGDVYSLPVLPDSNANGDDTLSGPPESASPDESTKVFKPAATNLTVHTQRNRKALEAQMKQPKVAAKTKEPLKFERKLLLGHVSMLTDLAYATQNVDGKQRGYIITADRDEHIRVSRCPPQSHVIEGYCLGHKEFVSKICLVPGTDLLVTGGGDHWVGIWNWPRFQLLQKIDRFSLMMRDAQSTGSMESTKDEGHVAVSGMWAVPAEIDGRPENIVAVACESIPRLAYFHFSQRIKDEDVITISAVQEFEAPILDIACTGNTIIISFDARGVHQTRMRAYQLLGKTPSEIKAEEDPDMDVRLEMANSVWSETTDGKSLDGLLYGVGTLRKRSHLDGANEED